MTEILICVGIYSVGIITGICIVFGIAVKEEAKARNVTGPFIIKGK